MTVQSDVVMQTDQRKKRPLPLSERSRSSDSLKDHLAEEVHDQFDNVGVKILQRNILARRRRRKPRTEAPSHRTRKWNSMSEDSSQELKMRFFVMFTPSSETQAQRASLELSTVCEDSENEIRQLVTQRETSTGSSRLRGS